MNTIKEIKSWPADAAVEAVQGKIVAVYERRNVNTKYGMKTVQSAELQDTTGEKIKIGAWDHPDLKPLEGKEIILHSPKGQNGKASGVKVMHDSYTNKANQQVVETKLSVSKAGQFQLVEVYHQTNPQMAANRTESASNGPSSDAPASAPTTKEHMTKEEGQRFGMCYKLAGDFAIAGYSAGLQMNDDEFVEKVASLAVKLVDRAKQIEADQLSS